MKNKSVSHTSQQGQVPKLRFPEFCDAPDWKNRRLGFALIQESREIKKPDNHYTGLGIRSHGKGTFLKDLQDPDKNSMDRLYKVECNDLVVNITFAWEGAIAIANDCDHGALVSHRFPTYTFIPSKASPDFFRQIITTKDFVYKLSLISPGGAGRNRVMNKKNFLDLKFFLPDVEEQQKIADCFTSLDELIAAHTQKLDTLKAFKKGLVQQLFPAESETVPRLRFPEFRDAGEWEEKTLGNVAIFAKGKGISKAEISLNGSQPCIRYGELYTHYKETISSVVSCTNIPSDDLVLSQANDVIIPASGETQIDIATASCVLRSGVALGGDLNIIRSKMNGIFLSYYLNNAKKKAIAELAQGISVVHLYASQLKTLKINIPEIPEQQKIANTLSSIDYLIASQSQKLEALRIHKKGLMQQLFPSTDEVNG